MQYPWNKGSSYLPSFTEHLEPQVLCVDTNSLVTEAPTDLCSMGKVVPKIKFKGEGLYFPWYQSRKVTISFCCNFYYILKFKSLATFSFFSCQLFTAANDQFLLQHTESFVPLINYSICQKTVIALMMPLSWDASLVFCLSRENLCYVLGSTVLLHFSTYESLMKHFQLQ